MFLFEPLLESFDLMKFIILENDFDLSKKKMLLDLAHVLGRLLLVNFGILIMGRFGFILELDENMLCI